MKIKHLLIPDEGGANGVATQTTETVPQVQTTETQTTESTPARVDPGTEARTAREERIARENKELWGNDAETKEVKPEVKVVPVVNPQNNNQPLTAQQIANIAAETASRVRQQPAPQQVPQLTQDDIDKQLGVVKITPEMCVELGLPAEAAPFLDKLQKGIVTNAVRMSDVIIQQKLADMQRGLAPHISFAQHQQQLVLEQQFREAHPDLKGYEPVVKDISDKLAKSGFRGTQAQAFAKVAEETKKYLMGMGIDPSKQVENSNGVASAATTTSSKPIMSTVSKGSQGGAGGAPKSNAKQDAWQDIWAKN